MQGEIYHTIKASQMYAPFQRRQEEDKGGVKWGVSSSRDMREEVGMRRPDAVRVQAGAGDWICAGTHIEHF